LSGVVLRSGAPMGGPTPGSVPSVARWGGALRRALGVDGSVSCSFVVIAGAASSTTLLPPIGSLDHAAVAGRPTDAGGGAGLDARKRVRINPGA
jgi:hypothetical protein